MYWLPPTELPRAYIHRLLPTLSANKNCAFFMVWFRVISFTNLTSGQHCRWHCKFIVCTFGFVVNALRPLSAPLVTGLSSSLVIWSENIYYPYGQDTVIYSIVGRRTFRVSWLSTNRTTTTNNKQPHLSNELHTQQHHGLEVYNLPTTSPLGHCRTLFCSLCDSSPMYSMYTSKE